MTDSSIKYAGFWRRVLAMFIDSIVLFAIILPVFIFVVFGFLLYIISQAAAVADGSMDISQFGALMQGFENAESSLIVIIVLDLLLLLVYILYFAGSHSSLRQATYGKMMLGIKVTDEDGFKISFMRGVGRYFASVLSVLTFFIGFLMAGFTKQKQALHDIVAKTLVIREGGCFFWPAFKTFLISILVTVFLIAGALFYISISYKDMDLSNLKDYKNFSFDNKPIKEIENNIDEKIVPYLEQRNDGLLYEQNGTLPFTGKKISYYENGQKKEEASVVTGYWEGPYTLWHENGQKKEAGNYEKSILNGMQTIWYESGQKQQEVNIKNGVIDGPYTIWSVNGQKEQSGTYKENKLHGQVTIWDQEGNTVIETYENGELVTNELENTTTTENNNIASELQSYEENVEESETLVSDKKESFYENGQKKTEANYINGKLNGPMTLWNESGQKLIQINYKEDIRHGLLTRWYANGQKKVEINYNQGQRDGVMTFWFENGDIKKTISYSNGEKK